MHGQNHIKLIFTVLIRKVISYASTVGKSEAVWGGGGLMFGYSVCRYCCDCECDCEGDLSVTERMTVIVSVIVRVT